MTVPLARSAEAEAPAHGDGAAGTDDQRQLGIRRRSARS